jgi:hypothetical protein
MASACGATVHERNAVVLLVLAGCPGSGDEATSVGSTSEAGTTGGSEVGTTIDEPTGCATTNSPTTGDTTDATTGEPPGEDPNVFFVPARQGDQAFVLRVSPAAGVAEPFGPALPVAADDLRSPDVLATPDGSLVTVRCYLEDEVPLATLLVGDGASWQDSHQVQQVRARREQHRGRRVADVVRRDRHARHAELSGHRDHHDRRAHLSR